MWESRLGDYDEWAAMSKSAGVSKLGVDALAVAVRAPPGGIVEVAGSVFAKCHEELGPVVRRLEGRIAFGVVVVVGSFVEGVLGSVSFVAQSKIGEEASEGGLGCFCYRPVRVLGGWVVAFW